DPSSFSPHKRNLDVVRIGYVGSGFPLVYENIHGEVAGIHKEMWSDTLRNNEIKWFKRSVYGSYDVDANGLFDGMLGEMQNGTLEVALQVKDFSYRKSRMNVLHYTLPIGESKENFYEARQTLFSSSIIVVPFQADFTAILVFL
ncbi:hypothetical protein PFISCL1PPCAC_28009, partial [Pristionchus fissidentatus]